MEREAEPQLGAPIHVRVATWSARQLGVDGGLPPGVDGLLDSLDADLVALQEVASPSAFEALRSQLPAYEGALGLLAPSAGGLQQAWLWRREVLSLEGLEALWVNDAETFPRPPLQATVSLLGHPASRFRVLGVHLKAGKGDLNEQRRITLGDFNEALSDPRSAEAFGPFTSRPQHYRFLTPPLAAEGAVTFLPAGSWPPRRWTKSETAG